VAATNGVTLILAAYLGRTSLLHGAGLPCLALAVLLAVQLALTGGPPPDVTDAWLLARLRSLSRRVAPALLAGGVAAVAVVLERGGHADHGRAHALTGAGLAALALLVATARGPEHPALVAFIHGFLAATALAACAHAPRHRLAQPGAWLLLPASLWA